MKYYLHYYFFQSIYPSWVRVRVNQKMFNVTVQRSNIFVYQPNFANIFNQKTNFKRIFLVRIISKMKAKTSLEATIDYWKIYSSHTSTGCNTNYTCTREKNCTIYPFHLIGPFMASKLIILIDYYIYFYTLKRCFECSSRRRFKFYVAIMLRSWNKKILKNKQDCLLIDQQLGWLSSSLIVVSCCC